MKKQMISLLACLAMMSCSDGEHLETVKAKQAPSVDSVFQKQAARDTMQYAPSRTSWGTGFGEGSPFTLPDFNPAN